MRKAIKLLLILTLFFILGTSTSADIDLVEYDCLIEHEGNSIIITSQSNIDIESAFLQLGLNSTLEDLTFYFINGYSLNGMGIDTIPIIEFLNPIDSVPFPVGENPSSFFMEFSRLDTVYNKEHVF